MASDEELKALRAAADKADKNASKLLDDDLQELMKQVDKLKDLKPQTTDEQTYQKLISAVEEATAKNHSIATLRENLMNLGSGVVSLVKDAAEIARKFP